MDEYHADRFYKEMKKLNRVFRHIEWQIKHFHLAESRDQAVEEFKFLLDYMIKESEKWKEQEKTQEEGKKNVQK